MLLAVDIGNTNILLGVYDRIKLLCVWRITTDKKMTADEYGRMILKELIKKKIDKEKIDGMEIACVVPPLITVFRKMCSKFFKINPFIVKAELLDEMDVLYDDPSEVGADRVVNAIAGFNKYGGPLVVIDFGTATTFDVVNIKGAYLGGVIIPGIGISSHVLFEKTAKLPLLKFIKAPRKVIGKNTKASINSGLFVGCIGQVKEIMKRIEKELKNHPKVIATGGSAGLFSRELRAMNINIDKHLTLDGLRIIYENKKINKNIEMRGKK